ncbi:glycosyltransferase involved in cell wall biosynthesis [Salinibacter ruber]|uniref:glycosyltransferase family 4 protein n=1 Tax=Salinibacter ruber TaxID=146919 RepID=UPI002167A64A|nr:glycosyltransferase family 4 protein [Salinibacter ruber]MCS3861657.1 glycosyltransferase involved in cell wall biosynthesis [Salinibacter ruber]
MKVYITVFGRHHAHRLAYQMQKRGMLGKINIGYHGSVGSVKNKYIVRYFPIHAIRKSIKRVTKYDPNYSFSRIFDRIVKWKIRQQLDEGDIFYGWAGHCLESLKEAKKIGATTFIERSCPHIEFQKEVLKEESKITGIKYSGKSLQDEIMKKEYEETDYIVTPSTYSYESFVDSKVDIEKVLKVNLGARIYDKDKKNKEDDTFRVLYVGGNALRKGLFYLLKAWNKMSLNNSELVIRGNVPLGLKKHTETDNIKVVGRVNRKKLRKMYQNSSVFCLPSVDEGFGMVVSEAMSHSLPVIITENVGAKDIVKDEKDGFIIPIRDCKKISEKVQFLKENKKRAKKMGKNAKKKAKKYTWNRYGMEMKKCFKKLG